MPAADTGGAKTGGPRRRVRHPKPPQPRPTAPPRQADQDEATRSRGPAKMTPDQADRERTPAQRTRDAATVARNVRVSRTKYVVKRRQAEAHAFVTGHADPRYIAPPVDRSAEFRAARAASSQQRAARLAPVLTILQQLSRPVHAEAAASRELVRQAKQGEVLTPKAFGKALKPFGRGAALKDKSLFSDVLKEAGVKNKAITGIGGFALDVGLDPTTYLSFGAGSPVRKAAEKEARKATEKALAQGASKKAANKAGRAAAAKVIQRETNNGLRIGAGDRQTSGRTTARVSRALHVPQASEKARGALPGRLVRHVAPSVRPAGVSSSDFNRVRDAMRRGRAIASNGEGTFRSRAQAIARVLPGGTHPQITDALEGRSLAGLTDKEQKVAQALAHDYDQMHRAEHAAGLVGGKFGDFGYSPRRVISELEPSGSRRRMGGAQLESSKARTNRKPYAAFRGTDDDVYTENAALAYYLRGRDSAVKLGRKVVIDALHSVGRRWHPGAALKDGEEIFKFAPRKMPAKVEGDELRSLLRGGAPPGLNEYRVLHTELVRTAEQGVPQRLEGLEEIGRIWDRQIQGRVKTILTVPNPQYHLTNLYGDLFNAYKAAPVLSLAKNLGISAAALTYRARREAAAKTLAKQVDPASLGVKIGGRKITLDKLILEAEQVGAINQGFIGRDLAEVLDHQGRQAQQAIGQSRTARLTGGVGRRVATSRVGSKIAHPLETIRGASQYREDSVRLALYITRRRKGDTPDEASRFTNRHLLDYGDLTQLEKSVLRRVLPFYTFTARNFPQQVRALVERPGKYANLEKVREEGQKASDLPEGYEGDLQKYEQQGAPIPVPGSSNLLYPKLPVTDLGRLTVKDQGNYLMAMLTPLIKSPVELDQNYSFFLRKKIDELVDAKGPHGENVETLKPAPPAILALINKAPGPLRKEIAKALRLKQYTDQKTGKKVIGWPARVDYVWRSTPATNFASSAGSQIPNSRGQSPGQATFGYLTGLKVVPYSPPDVAKNNAGKTYDYLEAVAKKMRHDGTAYSSDGNRTVAYQKVLDQARKAFQVIDPTPPKQSSFLSPQELKDLQALRNQLQGGGPGLSDAERQALAGSRRP